MTLRRFSLRWRCSSLETEEMELSSLFFFKKVVCVFLAVPLSMWDGTHTTATAASPLWQEFLTIGRSEKPLSAGFVPVLQRACSQAFEKDRHGL